MCSGSQVVNTFHLVERVVSLQNSSGNVHQILLSRYFRKELQQRTWGRGLPGGGIMGSCLVTGIKQRGA